MRTSQFLLATLKETPADAEVISHQLMLRAGMIRKLAAGLYTWLPLGVRVLRNIEKIIREEMNKAGALEVLMPVVQPAELWDESGRWDQYGAELLRMHDRHQRDFCLGPTHEEVITDLVRNEIQSYKQLPLNLYQVQTKFRDEIRPRFGVMRSREFIMKDAYSFHLSQECLEKTYQRMYAAYAAIFDRIGLDYRAVLADTGSIGGSASHEFHVLADSGEDAIAFSDGSDYAANIEMATAPTASLPTTIATTECCEIATPEAKTIAAVADTLQCATCSVVKTLIVKGSDAPLVALVLRGDHELNAIKAAKLDAVAEPLQMASDEEIRNALGCGVGSIGPANLSIPVIVDHSAAALPSFVCGANRDGFHLTGVQWGRDTKSPETADLRNVVAGDQSPDGKGKLEIRRGIEVGHIFQLGKKYSDALQATVLNEQGKSETLSMGCYGIGVTRIAAAAIEQNHDENGILWPESIAPFKIVLIPLNMQKSEEVRALTEELYAQLQSRNIDVLLDDRNERPGIKFADMELIGIPHRLVIGDKGIAKGVVEYRARTDRDNTDLPIENALASIMENLDAR